MISQERTLTCDGKNGASPVQLPPETKMGIDPTGYITKTFTVGWICLLLPTCKQLSAKELMLDILWMVLAYN